MISNYYYSAHSLLCGDDSEKPLRRRERERQRARLYQLKWWYLPKLGWFIWDIRNIYNVNGEIVEFIHYSVT